MQGEGPLVGVRQMFVRVRGCDLTCKYCDTPGASDTRGPCRVETRPGSGEFTSEPNPLSAAVVAARAVAQRPGVHSLALTGGEPLLYPDFVNELARAGAKHGLPLYLETGGHRPEQLREVIAHVGLVSMDFKLPSTLETPVPVQAFADSYEIAQGRIVAVKLVVTRQVTEGEVAAACELLASVSQEGPVVLQPVTPVNDQLQPPDGLLLTAMYQAATRFIKDVRVIPQCHRLLGVL